MEVNKLLAAPAALKPDAVLLNKLVVAVLFPIIQE
jgi:hypothetical protein